MILGSIFSVAILIIISTSIPSLSWFEVAQQIQKMFISWVIVKVKEVLVNVEVVFSLLVVDTVPALVFEMVAVLIVVSHLLFFLVIDRNIHHIVADCFS